MAIIIDSFSETNQDNSSSLRSDNRIAYGQSFTGIAAPLNSAAWYIKKTGSPTGNVTYKLYEHSGTFGTNSIPTGAALATSEPLDSSTLTTSYQLIELNFPTPVTLVNATNYVIVIDFSGGSLNNTVDVGRVTVPGHPGNFIQTTDNINWAFNSGTDFCFYTYCKRVPSGSRTSVTSKTLISSRTAVSSRNLV